MMINYKNLENKKVLVMGLGLHGGGVSVVNWLSRQGARILVTDLKTKKELASSIKKIKSKKVEYILGKHRLKDFKEADLVIQNPGVPMDSKYIKIAREKKIPIENEASLFFRLCPAPIIAVTGSKGKSTLAFLLYKLLKKRYKDTLLAGNIRDVLMLDILSKIKKSTKVVLELSSWHLEGMAHLKKSPHVAVITNIMPEHLNRYKSMKDYVKAKALIFQFQKKQDFAVINTDNLWTRKLCKKARAKTFCCSTKKFGKNGAFEIDNKFIFVKNGQRKKLFSIRDFNIFPIHNVYHFLAAAVVGKILNISNNLIKKTIINFKGLHDRLEFLGEKKGIKYYNDTTATIPEASISALKTLGNSQTKNIILLAGGADKNLDFKSMSKSIERYCKEVILFKGKASTKIKKALNNKKIISHVLSMKEAVKKAEKNAVKNDIILLSPGAASFGLFSHEFDRGEQFKKYTKAK